MCRVQFYVEENTFLHSSSSPCAQSLPPVPSYAGFQCKLLVTFVTRVLLFGGMGKSFVLYKDNLGLEYFGRG